MRRDPIELEIFKNFYHSIAEEMGAALQRTAFSPNIQERRDYSCAVFDGQGQVIAMGDHMPVHLGSMPMSVQAAIEAGPMDPGDVVMLNDPFRGGTHLPDITLVAPVYVGKSRRHARPDFYVASRAHHADVGGAYAGSMGLCREIYQEGVRIPPVKLMQADAMQRDVLAMLLNNVRTPQEREGDLGAQIAACHTGAERLREVCARYGIERAKRAAADLLEYSEELMRAFLRRVPPGEYRAEDFLDSDGITERPVRIAVMVKVDPADRGQHMVTVDFTGSDPQVEGSINAVAAITYSACFYVFRCLLAEDVPAAAGLMRPIDVIAPEGTVVNARPPAAVAGGNVETSQRMVDVLLRALAQALPDSVPAAASGTMNNLTIGSIDRRTGEPFTYYETIAGGMGARPGKASVSGVHTHMTNSLNTPAEALEYAYPLRVRSYSLRSQSGGHGEFRGGDGIIREIEVLTDCEVTLLADRRSRGPWGLCGGLDGAPGRATVVRKDGTKLAMAGKFSTRLRPGERIRIETPGGGGWGPLKTKDFRNPGLNSESNRPCGESTTFREAEDMTDAATHYLEEARRQLRGHKRMGEGAMSQLLDEEFMVTLDPEANSVAILVKHIAGNMRSRFTDFLTSDGEKPHRFRDREFELGPSTTRAEVMKWWEEGWACVFSAIDPLKPEDVMRTVTIRGEPHTVLQAVNRQIAHYAQHIGQIVFLAKHLRSSDWKTLSIPRGKSEEFNQKKAMSDKYERGVLREK